MRPCLTSCCGCVDKIVAPLTRQLPVDLRKPLINSIILTGGTAMHPGFCSRFKTELRAALDQAGPFPPSPKPRRSTFENRFACLAGLRDRIGILDDPETGRGPGFAPHLLGWIGASLLGALKISSLSEMTREVWDEASVRSAAAGDGLDAPVRSGGLIPTCLADWSRPQLGPLSSSPVGA